MAHNIYHSSVLQEKKSCCNGNLRIFNSNGDYYYTSKIKIKNMLKDIRHKKEVLTAITFFSTEAQLSTNVWVTPDSLAMKG